MLLDLDGFKVVARINPKSARKLVIHPGGAVLQGRLLVESGHLVLKDAGFSFIDTSPAPTPSSPPTKPVT
jgi:hypothetical protein